MITYEGPFKPTCHIASGLWDRKQDRWRILEHLPYLESLGFYPPTVKLLMEMAKP